MITLTAWSYHAPVWSGTTGLEDGVELSQALPQICVQAPELTCRDEALEVDDGLWIWVNLTLH